MIAFLPVWILGVPLVLALIDLMATRSGARDVHYESHHDTVPAARHGLRGELRRGDESSPVAGQAYRENSPANVS
jgi:hypothetical protein